MVASQGHRITAQRNHGLMRPHDRFNLTHDILSFDDNHFTIVESYHIIFTSVVVFFEQVIFTLKQDDSSCEPRVLKNFNSLNLYYPKKHVSFVDILLIRSFVLSLSKHIETHSPCMDDLHASHDEMDFLALLESESLEDSPSSRKPLAEMNDEQLVPVQESCPDSALVERGEVGENEASPSMTFSFPSLVGKVGSGRHGSPAEQSLLMYHMRHVKSLKKHHHFRTDMAELLQDCTLSKSGHRLMIQTKATSTGLLVQIARKAQNGNRYKRAIPWGTFLQTAYGQLVRSRHIALSLQVSQSMVTMMSSMVSSVFLSQQLLLLARLATLAESTRPFLCVQHLKWDETQLECSVNPDRASRRVRSAWQVMVSRLRILLSWLDGSNIVIRLVMPPVVLLGSAAHDIFYALRFHPSYKALNQMLAVLASRCDHRAQILESDGAYANERLVAHLIQKNKNEPEHLQHHLMHVKCHNHQSQLVNVAVLAGVGHEILNKLYGMTVFIRNLGYFLRLRQAVESWVDQNFVQADCHWRKGIRSRDTSPHLFGISGLPRAIEED